MVVPQPRWHGNWCQSLQPGGVAGPPRARQGEARAAEGEIQSATRAVERDDEVMRDEKGLKNRGQDSADVANHRIAILLGAQQEARRLKKATIGTEHLLMATLADPTVRWVMRGLGHDLREVQTLVIEASQRRPDDSEQAATLTDQAGEAIAQLRAQHPKLDPHGPRSNQRVSRALRSLMTTFLTDDRDTAARRILRDLGALDHAESLTALIDGHAGPAQAR